MSVWHTRGFGRLRRLLAPLVLVLAIGSVWLGPGLVWRQVSASEPAGAAGGG